MSLSVSIHARDSTMSMYSTRCSYITYTVSNVHIHMYMYVIYTMTCSLLNVAGTQLALDQRQCAPALYIYEMRTP